MAVIGIDLGGTKIAGAIFTEDAHILRKETTLIRNRTGKEVGILVLEVIQHLMEYSDSEKIPLSGIGCCVPGAVDQESGNVWAPNIAGWENYPLRQEIAGYFNNRDIIVNIDSDRACSILGEVWQGAARGCNNAVFLAIGTGIGAGILADGRILRGSHDIAGAVGWMALMKPYRQKYSRCGCFEYHASGEGLARVAREYLAENPDYRGPLGNINPEEITAREIFETYHMGDIVAGRVIHEAIECWGMAAANLVSLFNPEMIVFGGGLFGPAGQFLEEIFTEAEKWAQPVSIRQVKFEVSALGGDAAMIGSACLATMNDVRK